MQPVRRKKKSIFENLSPGYGLEFLQPARPALAYDTIRQKCAFHTYPHFVVVFVHIMDELHMLLSYAAHIVQS